MSTAIVNENKTNVNPFSSFRSKVERYAQAVKADTFKCYDNGDRYTAIVYGAPTVRLYSRPNSLKILAKIGYNLQNCKTVEIS